MSLTCLLDGGAGHRDARGLCGCGSTPGACNPSMMGQPPGDLLSNGIYKIKGVGDVLAGRVERENSVARIQVRPRTPNTAFAEFCLSLNSKTLLLCLRDRFRCCRILLNALISSSSLGRRVGRPARGEARVCFCCACFLHSLECCVKGRLPWLRVSQLESWCACFEMVLLSPLFARITHTKRTPRSRKTQPKVPTLMPWVLSLTKRRTLPHSGGRPQARLC